MHTNVDEHLTKNAPRATKTVVSASEWTIGGSLDYNELEALIRSGHQYNTKFSLEAGVLKARLGST